MHRLAVIHIPAEENGPHFMPSMVGMMQDYMETRGRSRYNVPALTRADTHTVSGLEDPTGQERQGQTFFAFTRDDRQMEALLDAVERQGLSEKGVVAICGSGALAGQRKLSVPEIRATIRRLTLGTYSYALVGVAAVIAAVGLAADSGTSVVASMLVSPLMSPVLQLAYALADPVARRSEGTKMFRTRRGGFCREACVHVALAAALCVLAGVGCGLCGCLLGVDEYHEWPTDQMKQRCEFRALPPGLVVALASGLGAAIAVRSDGVNALVGVAISASLLPPLVNCGIFCSWGWASQTIARDEAARKAAISASLTLINVMGIVVSAALIFWIRLWSANRGGGSSGGDGGLREYSDHPYRPLLAT